MKTQFKKIAVAISMAKAKLIHKKMPLVVNFILTRRCNYLCAYCSTSSSEGNELTTEQILSLIKELTILGMKRISFTGGEPLLRDDLSMILPFCKKQGLLSSINTNGSLVASKIDDIIDVDCLHLSLDGPEEVHDQIRGRDSFQKVMAAVRIAKRRKIKFTLNVTLSALNLDYLDFFFAIANDFKSFIFFQPAVEDVLRGFGKNPLAPQADKYKKIIERIIEAKKHNPFIGNSLTGLRHLRRWPVPHPSLRCSGGILFCQIDVNGDLTICGTGKGKQVAGNVLKDGLKQSFTNIKQVNCDFCWSCQRVEFNYLYSLDFYTLLNSIKLS